MDASARSHLSCALQRYRLGCCVLICPKGRFPTGLAFSQPDRSILTWPGSSRFRDIKAPAGRVRIPNDLKPSTVKKFKTTIYDMRLNSLNVTVFLSLVSLASGALVRRVTCPNGKSVSNDKCCALFPILEDIQANLFDHGECGEDAHSALRIAFHDAIGYSTTRREAGGGADGSIYTFAEKELAYHANDGIDEIIARQKPFIERYAHTLTPGDFIQFAAAVGVSNCPGAPRLEFQFGRPLAVREAAQSTVPEPSDEVATILERFMDAGFGPEAVVALLASHSIAAADQVDPTARGSPFDSTPGVFDSQFHVETLLKGGTSYPGTGPHKGEVPASRALRGEMRLQSDHNIARDPRTACHWQRNIEDEDYMVSSFKIQMAKLAVLGQDTAKLVDCSEVIPVPKQRKRKVHLPAGTSPDDIEASCYDRPFPNLTADPGPPHKVKPVKS